MQKITPCLWFNDQAEEAVNFYVAVFNNAKIIKVKRYDASGAEVSGRPKGSVMTIQFQLDGQEFIALNGGPEFTFSLATSFIINCKTQEEVDMFWEKFTKEGKELPCGWVTDKFGVTWQVVPTILPELLSDPDPVKSEKVMKAMLQMHKIDIKKLKIAYNT